MVSILKKRIIFAHFSIVLLVWPVDGVPNLYQVKLKYVNAQLQKDKLSVK